MRLHAYRIVSGAQDINYIYLLISRLLRSLSLLSLRSSFSSSSSTHP